MIQIVTYNLLSQPLAQSHLVFQNQTKALEQAHRYQLIQDQISKHMSSFPKPIFCFQELNQSLYCHLQPFISQNGYELIYAPYANQKSDFMGVAIAYNKLDFQINRVMIKRLVDQKQWQPAQKSFFQRYFPTFITSYWDQKNSYQLASYRQNKYISVELERKDNKKQFCITNYHMPCAFLDPQLMNMHVLLIAQASQEFSENKPNILCGDFNIQPNSSSYEILTNGQINQNHQDYPQIPKNDNWQLKCQSFKSAHKEYFGQEPELTNCAQMKKGEKFEGCLDYIFYNDKLKVESMNQIFQEKPELLPSMDHPSDHLPISAYFSFI